MAHIKGVNPSASTYKKTTGYDHANKTINPANIYM
jgi:hypothetical protein